MDLDTLQKLLRFQRGGLVIRYPDGVPPARVCNALASRLIRPPIVVRLRSDHISKDEAASLHRTLTSGQALLLIGAEAETLPGELQKAWQEFSENNIQTGAGRWIRFSRSDAEGDLGLLLVLVPRSYAGFIDTEATTVWLDDSELGTEKPLDLPIAESGRARADVSMELLCMMHHRDPPGASSSRSVGKIMQGGNPLTWQELKLLLRTQPNLEMLGILEGFADCGRLSDEQLDFASEAIAFLDQERGHDERHGSHSLEPSIHHLVWKWEHLEDEGCVFRGQVSSCWQQDSSLLRPTAEGRPADYATIQSRLDRTLAFVAELERCEQKIVGRRLDDDERLAIAQHYGMPTPLLDYTRSIGVAAFFATGAGAVSEERHGDVGIIYYIHPREWIAKSESDRGKHSFDLRRAAGIRGGQLRSIEPDLPDAENRIARQRALFLDGFDTVDLQRLSIGTLYFRHVPGVAFEDPARGISTGRLLHPDARLQKLAEGTSGEERGLPAWVRSVRFPGDDVFGSVGAGLTGNLHKGQRFLDLLFEKAEGIEPGLSKKLHAILERHFTEARIVASTSAANVSAELRLRPGQAGMRQTLDEVDATLAELAELAGIEPASLSAALRQHRPHQLIWSSGKLFDEPIGPVADGPLARVALAVGLFVVGFEYLRSVPGQYATQYIQNAEYELQQVWE